MHSDPFFQKCTEFLKADNLIRLCLSPLFFLPSLWGSPLRCAGDLHVPVIYCCWLHPSIVYLGKSHNKPTSSLLNIDTSCLDSWSCLPDFISCYLSPDRAVICVLVLMRAELGLIWSIIHDLQGRMTARRQLLVPMTLQLSSTGVLRPCSTSL